MRQRLQSLGPEPGPGLHGWADGDRMHGKGDEHRKGLGVGGRGALEGADQFSLQIFQQGAFGPNVFRSCLSA